MAKYVKRAVFLEEDMGIFRLRDGDGKQVGPSFQTYGDARRYRDGNGYQFASSVEDAHERDLDDAVEDAPFTEETLCQFCGGILNGKVMTVAELRKQGIEIVKNPDRSAERDAGHLCPARIFDNAPHVKGYCGPMWGGREHPLRYETREVYDALSI